MVKIDKANEANACHMLRTQATLLGWVGEFTFYMLDGKLWGIGPDDVSRCDDPDEQAEKLALVKRINHITANNYPVRVYADAEVEIGTSPKQMEANGGRLYLTRRELIAMLAMLEPPPAREDGE